MVLLGRMTKNKNVSTCSEQGSSSSGASSSSESSSTSSSESSSDTEQSSAPSVRFSSRNRTQSTATVSTDSDSPKKSVALKKGSRPVPQNAVPSHSRGPVRASSDSEHESSSHNKRGPKFVATTVPKNAPLQSSKTKELPRPSVPLKKTPKPAPGKAVVKSVPLKKASTPAAPPKSNAKPPPPGAGRKPPDRKGGSTSNKSLFIPDDSSASETENVKIKKLPVKKSGQKPPTPVTPTAMPLRGIKGSIQRDRPVQSQPHLKKSSVLQVFQKSAERTSSSANSSASSESDTDTSSSNGSSSSSSAAGQDGKRRKSSAATSESDKEDGRKQIVAGDRKKQVTTRSSIVDSKRNSLLGIAKGATDSDSEPGSLGGLASGGKDGKRPAGGRVSRVNSIPSPKKPMTIATKGGPKTKKTVRQTAIENASLPPIECRKCPVEGCDSSGHLAGLYDRHFTVDACPIFHNFSKDECRSNREIRERNSELREKARVIMGSKSPRNTQTAEQKTYCNKIRDARDRLSEKRPGDDEMADRDRQPSLRGYTPEWDLQLFTDAQAMSGEKIEDKLRGLTDSKGIRFVEMGHYEMQAWYQSQYPDDYNQSPRIYICEFCLKYMRSKTILKRHMAKCVWKHPPGDEIYKKDKLSFWEVDGKKYKTYCQNLCLLAMLFLDHKTLYYDVEPFLFYIMTLADSEGCHNIGYFSKEKNSFLNYNVSCILTLPPYQRKGFGRLLIDFSYQLTRMEGKIGSPEKPLSDLGLISYRSYWKDILLSYLSGFKKKNISIKDISQEMAVNAYDIVSTFQAMGMMKYWKGKHIILKRQDLLEDREKRRSADQREIDPKCLNWRPYVAPPSQAQAEGSPGSSGSNKLAVVERKK